MGHTAEDHERLESRRRDKNRDRDSDSGRQSSKNSGSKHHFDKKGKNKPSNRKDRGPSKPTPLRDEAIKGVSPEVAAQRKKDGVCLRCGKAGHRWSECWSKEPHKEKRKESSGDSGNSAAKKQKTSGGAAAAVRAASEPASDSGRIMKIPDDERDDSDFDLWA
jgi:hypothetical protein